MTFTDILADTYRRLRYDTAPASTVVTRIKAFVNETHEELLSMPGLSPLLYGTMTVASVATQARYGLSGVAQVRTPLTDATNAVPLLVRSLAWYRSTNPAPSTNTGDPVYVVPLGQVAVAQVPATTGTGVWAVSSSASDTGGPTVTIDAIRVGGYPHSPTATALTGTTRVQIGALTDYIDVTQFQLSGACVGDISLYDAVSSGNLLAVVPRGQTTSRYWGFILSPTPSTARTYTIDIEHEVQTLTASTDEPLLPPRFHRILAMGARMKEYEYLGNQDDKLQQATQAYALAVKELLYAVTCPPEYVAIPGNRLGTFGSNLGPYFPAGRW